MPAPASASQVLPGAGVAGWQRVVEEVATVEYVVRKRPQEPLGGAHVRSHWPTVATGVATVAG